MSQPVDLARVRHANALLLFDEFVHAHVKSADAVTLRGLERRFAERLQIQPSYWSQIKARSRQIGERLARQFEQLCRKPAGWMDQPHGAEGATAASGALEAPPAADRDRSGGGAALGAGQTHAAPPPSQTLDDDERFIVGLVLIYYRRHPQRARTKLLDLLGEVLIPSVAAGPASPETAAKDTQADPLAASRSGARERPPSPAPVAEDDLTLWQRSQAGVSPLPRKR